MQLARNITADAHAGGSGTGVGSSARNMGAAVAVSVGKVGDEGGEGHVERIARRQKCIFV